MLGLIPYNFEGVGLFKNSEQQKVDNSFLNNIFDENVIGGFEIAFKSYLDALAEGDLEFLKTILEPSFYEKMKDYKDHIEKSNLSLVKVKEDKDFEISIKKIIFNYGTNINRIETKKNLFHDHTMKKNFWIIDFFKDKSGKKDHSIVIQVQILLNSEHKLVLKQGDEKIKDDLENATHSHKVMFECEGNLSIWRIFTSFLYSIFLIKGNLKYLFFFKKSYEWTITDVDDFMNENPYVIEEKEDKEINQTDDKKDKD